MQVQVDHLLDRVKLELNPCRKGLNKEAMFVICSFDMVTERCLQVTVRRVLQVEYLAQHMTQKHGGHIIPVLEINNIFTTDRDSEDQIYKKIAEYLNDLIKNPHCKLDPKLYQFIFQQEVNFPQLQRYDKVLSDAAVMSRRYLNTIFTRKQYGEVQAEDKDMLAAYSEFRNFSTNFRSIREIILISGRQQTLLEDISSIFRQIQGGLAKGTPPVEFVSKRMQTKMLKVQKLIFQGEQAYARWQVLRQTVRQLQCNINKGLHEDNPYYTQKLNQLKKWTQSLMIDMKTLIQRGEEIITQYSDYLYKCKHEQAIWFGEQDPVILAAEEKKVVEESVLPELKGKKQWDPINEFKFKRQQWIVRKMSEG